ncbi:MAG: transglutaminase domain-containing protein [Christiangramia sp.]|uniref:transglutaminase domain-containing protein n=1 Tax=Christiangramia sp. TaxID=1931228 RepID=UPI003242A03E
MNKLQFLIVFLLVGGMTHAQNYKFGKVSEEEVAEKEHPKDKNADAAVLYKYERVYYDYVPNTGFQLVKEVEERIKIYNKDGFDWATKEIKTFKDGTKKEDVSRIKGSTYNLENGKMVEVKLDKDAVIDEESNRFRNTTKFTMPAVKEGSVLEYKYTVFSPFIGNMDDTYLQYPVPINKLYVTVSIPEFFIFGKYLNNKAPLYIPVKEGKEYFKFGNMDYLQNTYLIEEENIPALKEESHVDYLRNYAAILKWELQMLKFPNQPLENLSTTWEGVVKTIYNDHGISREVNRTGFFEEELDPIISKISDPQKKAQAVYNFVKQKMGWNSYIGYNSDLGTKKAYKEGQGNTADVNLMLTAMLKYAGLQSHPVLVSTPANGIPLFPTRNGFNYVVSSVEINGKLFLLDATDPSASIGELPKRARNWQGRLIREDGSSDWVNLNPNYMSSKITRFNLKFEDGQIVGKHFLTMDGLHAKNYRSSHAGEKVDDLLNATAEARNDCEISEFDVKNLDAVGAEVTENYSFTTYAGKEQIGDKIYFKPLMFETMNENPFKSEERIYPIFFDFPSRNKKTINIMVPEGFEVVSVPESQIVKLKDNAGEFRYIVNKSGNFIRVESELSMAQTVFNPADYEYLKKFYDNMIKKQNETIVLGKISEDGSKERADSGR